MDKYFEECLNLATNCKSNLGFGSVLVSGGHIIGWGWNRRSTPDDRSMLTHVDYAVHAEQACIIDALKNGYDINNSDVYVAGMILVGSNKGTHTSRSIPSYGCIKCPHAFIKYNLHVNVPRVGGGWFRLSPQDAMDTGLDFYGKGNWEKFVKGEFSL